MKNVVIYLIILKVIYISGIFEIIKRLDKKALILKEYILQISMCCAHSKRVTDLIAIIKIYHFKYRRSRLKDFSAYK